MSSGPSARSEKPRAGSSICGDEMPRSRSAPSIARDAERLRAPAGSSENHARRNAKRGSSIARAAAPAPGSRSSATRRPDGPSASEDAPRVAAAAERRVDVDAVRDGPPARRRLLRAGRERGRHRRHQREKPSSSGGRPPGGNVIARAVCVVPARRVPQLELVALAHEHDVMLERRVLAQRGRDEDAAAAVDVDVVGETDEQPLQAADLGIERRQRHEARLDRLPRGARVDEQAARRIGGDDDGAGAAGSAIGSGATRASASRCFAGIASRPLASSASCDTPRNTAPPAIAFRRDSSLRHRVAPPGPAEGERLFTSPRGFARIGAPNAPLQPTFYHQRPL